MKPNPSLSGLATAANRVIELYIPEAQRLFDDRFTLKLLPPVWRVALKLILLPGPRTAFLKYRERQAPDVLGNLECRTRFIDEALGSALQRGVDQMVILGAGFDSRAYRIPGIDSTPVFEVELPGSQLLKQARLEKIFGTLPPHVVFVPIDFERQKLAEPMRAAGFHAGVKTFFIWEGVAMYLNPQAVDQTLAFIHKNSASGSSVIFDYLYSSALTAIHKRREVIKMQVSGRFTGRVSPLHR